jgi:mono/diheme cytochrome c family protein
VALCISCHRFKGAGAGEQGPDLGQPMNPVDYFQPQALRTFLRSSKQVRDWPDRKMPSFNQEVMSDEDMEALIAWLTYKARR